MAEVLDRAQELLDQAERELQELIPAGAEIFDAHVHTGTDIDGFVAPIDELVAFLQRWGASKAFAFCLDEPDRQPAFRAANDRTLAAAEKAEGMIIPFVRLDLAVEPVEEAIRCLDKGARGIKLHPRAQGFLATDERLEPIFALSAERRVPILIHGGRGLPPIADGLRRLHDLHPESQLIVAHAGIADLAQLSECFGGRAGVYFDTSVWSAIDLLDLYSRVSPGQILYASDYPYGQQPGSLTLALRTAICSGFDEDELRDMLGRTAFRIANGEPQLPLAPPKGKRTLELPITFARIHSYLAMATPMLWARQGDRVGALGLALNACAERDGHPAERERIAKLLAAAAELWTMADAVEDDEQRRPLSRMTMRLIQLANIAAVTTT